VGWISTAQHSTAQHSTAQHSTAQHSTAQHSTAQHSTAQLSTAQHSTAQHSTAQHSTAQHSTAQHSTAQHSTAQHSTAQHRVPGALHAGELGPRRAATPACQPHHLVGPQPLPRVAPAGGNLRRFLGAAPEPAAKGEVPHGAPWQVGGGGWGWGLLLGRGVWGTGCVGCRAGKRCHSACARSLALLLAGRPHFPTTRASPHLRPPAPPALRCSPGATARRDRRSTRAPARAAPAVPAAAQTRRRRRAQRVPPPPRRRRRRRAAATRGRAGRWSRRPRLPAR
jgi:hypothetical protein